jgi:peptide-methionine (S)-S-oxide reductase
VCSGKTGHAEVVKVEYDPAVASFQQLVSLWLAMHDPTMGGTRYRAGQYRSLVFFTTPEQEETLKKLLAQEQTKLRQPIATESGPAPHFWKAEEYHQQYYAKHKGASCPL